MGGRFPPTPSNVPVISRTALVEAVTAGVLNSALSAWARKKRKRGSTTAAETAAKNRAKRSVEHWANDWLALAHAAHPDYGRGRLAHYARKLFVEANKDTPTVADAAKRGEISEDRAQQFLDRQPVLVSRALRFADSPLRVPLHCSRRATSWSPTSSALK